MSSSLDNMSSSHLLTMPREVFNKASHGWGLRFVHCGKQLGDTSYKNTLIRLFGASDTHGPHFESFSRFSLTKLMALFARVFLTAYLILELFCFGKVGELLVDNLLFTYLDDFILGKRAFVIRHHVGFKVIWLGMRWHIQLAWCPKAICTYNSSFSYFSCLARTICAVHTLPVFFSFRPTMHGIGCPPLLNGDMF